MRDIDGNMRMTKWCFVVSADGGTTWAIRTETQSAQHPLRSFSSHSIHHRSSHSGLKISGHLQWVRGAVRNPGLRDKKYLKYEQQKTPLIWRKVDFSGPRSSFLSHSIYSTLYQLDLAPSALFCNTWLLCPVIKSPHYIILSCKSRIEISNIIKVGF